MSEFLKCDTPGCDYREEVPEITETMIGKPCPKCGANLLTRADWDIYVKMKCLFDILEKSGLARKAEAGEPVKPGEVRISVNPHDGDINIKISDK